MRAVRSPHVSSKLNSIRAKYRLQQFRQISQSRQLGDSLNIVDHPARLVRVNKKHGPGLIILGMSMSISSFPSKSKTICYVGDQMLMPCSTYL